MSSGVTNAGFIPKTFDELLNDIVEKANLPENFGEDFPTTPDSVFGILASIMAAQYKDQWDLAANIADQQNRDKAEGKFLNDLAALVGLTRIALSPSTGNLLFTGDQSVTIPNQTPVRDAENRLVLTQELLTLNRSLCNKSVFSIKNVLDLTTYTLNIEGDVWEVISDANATAAEVVSLFVTAIGTQTTYTATTGPNDTIIIALIGQNNSLTTTNDINLNLDSVSSLVTGNAVTTGPLTFLADTIVNLVSSIVGITSVTNPDDFTLGRLDETDEELRVRMSLREQSTGTATKPSIEASVSDVAGVSNTVVVENTTLAIDGGGRPPKSYETFVEGGVEEDIAQVIWDTKPAGIETHGTIIKLITDTNGDSQTVKFSRFLVQYAWVRVTYQINIEEIFPSNGEVLISQAVVETGDAFTRGEDFEPTKFYGNIYAKVSGIYVTNIEISLTALPNDTPVYQTTRIPVASTTDLKFDTVRVPVST